MSNLEAILELSQIGYIYVFSFPLSTCFQQFFLMIWKGYNGKFSCRINIGHDPKMSQVLPASFSQPYSSLFNNPLSWSNLIILLVKLNLNVSKYYH